MIVLPQQVSSQSQDCSWVMISLRDETGSSSADCVHFSVRWPAVPDFDFFEIMIECGRIFCHSIYIRCFSSFGLHSAGFHCLAAYASDSLSSFVFALLLDDPRRSFLLIYWRWHCIVSLPIVIFWWLDAICQSGYLFDPTSIFWLVNHMICPLILQHRDSDYYLQSDRRKWLFRPCQSFLC